jgi:putative iron-regulated protein
MHRLPPALLLLSLVACGSDGDDSKSFPTAKAELALANYRAIVNANYTDVVAGAQALQAAIDAFIAAPSAATQDAAKSAWIAARVPYAPSEAFRFYDGPIDDPMTGPEGQINSWPLDEFYIDYVREQPNSGIINDVANTPTITVETIARANEAAGEKAISTGYHAIEFLLWGQDDAVPGMGSGKRPFTDYLVTGGTAANQSRRADYLRAATQLLVSDVQEVAIQWKPGVADNFAAKFGVTASEGNAVETAIGDLLKSMGSLAKAELSGERMTVAYKSKDQEDEHSCFSDNTSVDLLGNGHGIQNVWLGRYGAIDGVGLDEVVTEKDATLAAKTTTDIATAVAKLQALADLQQQGTPLDVVISSPDGSTNRMAMLDAIVAVKAIGDDVERIAVALGLTIELEKPSAEL